MYLPVKPFRKTMISTVAQRVARQANRLLPLVAALGLALAPTWGTAAAVARLREGHNLKVAAIGTSLSCLWSQNHWFDDYLPTWLNSLGPGKVTMVNKAVSGAASGYGPGAIPPTPTSGLEQLGTALNEHPDIVFIEFAMNDAFLNYNLDTVTSKANLKSMIDQVLASGPKTEVVVQTMNNCLPGSVHAQRRPQLEAYYQGYRDVISTHYADNPRVVLVDNCPKWIELYETNPALWNIYVTDGIHPDAVGQEAIMIPNIKAALLAQPVPEPGAAVLFGTCLAAWLVHSKVRHKNHGQVE